MSLLALVAAAAFGHTGIPQSLSVNLRSGADSELLVSTTFGAVYSKDRGASWKVICEEAIGYGTGQRPAWWLSPSGAKFAGSFKGLFVNRTDGCFWEGVPDFEATGCSDIQAAGSTVLATSGKFGVENLIQRSTDDGKTWTASPEKSTTLFYSTLRIAPSNPNRVYVAAWWFEPVNSSLLLRSDDNGQTFARKDLSATLPAAGAFYVLGVHPSKPDVVFASVNKDTEPKAAWLLRSTDSGDSFTPVVTTTEIFSAVAFGPDPSIVYAASGNRLYRSTDEGLTFTPLAAPKRNACVTTRGNDVFSCGLQELDGWAVGQGDGGDFSRLLRWSNIAGPPSCPAGSLVKSLCEPLWPVVKATFPPEADAGIPDAGPAIDGGVDPLPTPKGCGCATFFDGPLLIASILFLRSLRQRW